jgi:hypothetical protein
MPVDGIRPSDRPGQPAELVIRNGRIHTGDAAVPAASAVAIRDADVRQGLDLTDAAAESAEQLRWGQRRGLGTGAGVPDLRRYPADPLLGCF